MNLMRDKVEAMAKRFFDGVPLSLVAGEDFSLNPRAHRWDYPFSLEPNWDTKIFYFFGKEVDFLTGDGLSGAIISNAGVVVYIDPIRGTEGITVIRPDLLASFVEMANVNYDVDDLTKRVLISVMQDFGDFIRDYRNNRLMTLFVETFLREMKRQFQSPDLHELADYIISFLKSSE